MSALMPPPARLSLSAPTSDHHHLAQLYADWWNVLAQHGKHPSAETMDAADRELGDGKAALHFDQKTERWVVGDHIDEDDVSMSLAVSLAVPRVKDPRSGTPVPRGYTGDWPDKLGRIYHWQQGKRIKGPTTKPAPKVKQQTQENTPTRNRLARQGDIDHAALAKHAGELSDFHKKAAKRSLNALYYHHGELTLHRLHEMAGQMQKDMDSLPEENETGRGRIRQQLAKVAHMAELAKGKGVSGKGIPIPPPDADEDKSKTKAANKPYTGKGAVDDQKIKEVGDGELEANGQKVRGRGARSGSVGSDAGRKPAEDKTGAGESPGKDGGVSGLPDGSVISGKGDDVQNGGPGDGPQDSPATGVGRPVEPILNETHAEASVAEEPTKENPTDCSAGNFRYSSTDFNFGGDKAKFKANVAAVRTLRAIQAEGRTTATPEEQAIMSRYVGWGQFPALFNNDKDWRKEAEEFKSLVSPEEFKSAQESIKNAHYTDPSVVEAHWKMAQKLGFKGGRFLETSAGIGYYMGLMPAELAARTHSSAVEKDDLSGQMLKLLYPASAVNVQGFEEYQAPDDFYHLVASNVPFGSYGVFEKRYAKFDAPIHDHFFLKSADLAAPGGLIMHITSTGTMDKVDDQTRRELADKCELVAAFRMPGEMHREGAGTDVVTDMVILRKKIPGLPETDPDVTPPEAMPKKELFTGVTIDSLGRLYHWKDGKRIPNPDWMGISSAPDPDGGADIVVNKYFMDHPENILGRLDRSGTMRQAAMKNVAMASPEELTEKMGRPVRVQVDAAGKRRYVFEDGSFVPNADLRRIGKELTQQRLEDALERLPSGVLRTDQTSKQAFEPNRLPAPGDVEDGAYTIRDGKVYVRKGGSLVEQQFKPKEVARLQGLLELRDARRASINAQNQNQDATEERGALNRAYDSFVKKYGPVHGKANRSLYSDDPDWPNVCSLENYDRKTNTATKMPIFFRDTVSMPKSVEKVSDLSEALGITMHEKGHIDVARMAQLLGSSEADVYKGLAEKNLAFKDPSAGWQTGEEYLSGNVRRKLVLARAAAATDPDFARNVSALEKVQPADVDFQDINAKLGVGWIPPRDIKEFAAFLIGGTADDFEIGYNPITAKWDADYSRDGWHLAGGGKALTWGTPKAKFMKLFEAALNNGRVTIKDKEGEVDWTATNDANAKIDDIRKEFNDKQMNSGWLWENEERRNRLHRLYNDNFNNIVETKYNGQHLKLPGIDPGFNLFPHIKDFVWRVITKGTGYAGFEVGTGKTATMVASAMELRRLGLAKKPALVCLKANIEQITKEALELYPGAKILSLVDKFGAKDRKEMLARIATGDYDMVIMTHDQLNKMKMKPEVRAKFIEGELDRVETAIRAAAAENPSKGNRIVKQLEDAKAKLLEKLKKATDESAKDDAIYFEDSGIDQLFVDEAHYFKNLPVYSKLGRVKGVPTAKSDRATNMLMRTQWLQQKNGGRGVVFLTGTPITNTMAELYNVQRYMQPDELAQRGLEHFDAWASQFTEAVPEVERTVSGEYKPVTRFRRFINLPELRHIASQVLDVQRAINLKKEDGSPIVVRPSRKDDTVKAPFTELQEKFMKDIGERAEAMKKRTGPPEKGQDNMLSVCTDGRKGAIDMRLVDPNAPDDPRYKSNMMVANVLKAYKENPGKTQLIFSDIGVNETTKSKHAASVGQGDVPEGEDEDEDGPPEDENDKAEANLGSNTGFHLYDDIINKLVKGGIPREKIADFSKLDKEKKAAAVAALKSGEMSIAIGSSKKLGTGNNVQDKLLYEHNLDVPWVPADLEQRIGRGWRHGNQNKDVNIVNYVTEQSLDEMFWNTVSTKAKWINQFMEGNVADREIEEQNSEVLSPDQVSAIASGNPKRLEMVSLKEDVDKLQAAKNRHEREQREFQSAVRMGQSKIKDFKEEADKLKELAAHVASQPEEFSIEIDGKRYDKRDEAKEALEKKIDEVKESDRRIGDKVKIGRFKGMDLYNTNWGNDLVGPNGVSLPTGVALGSVEHVARNVGKAAEGKESDYQRAIADVASVQAKIGKPFKHEEALKQKAARLAELQGELRSPEEKYHHQQEQMADAYNWEEGDAGSKKLGHFEVDRWGNVSKHGSVIGRMLVKDGGNAQSRGKALAAMLHQKLAGRYSFPYAEMDDVKKIIESFRSGSIPKDKDDRPIHIIDPAVVEKQREEAEAKAKRKKQSDYNKRELASALTSSYERQKELRQPPPSRLQPPEAKATAPSTTEPEEPGVRYAMYKGKKYEVLWAGKTRDGRHRARLGFLDGSGDFWVDKSAAGLSMNLRVGLSMDDDFEGCLLELNERGEIEVYAP